MKRTILLAVIIIMVIFCQTCKNTPREKHRVKTVIHYIKDNNPDSFAYRFDGDVIDNNKYLSDTTEFTYNADGHVEHVRFSWNRSKTDYEYLNGKIISRYSNASKNIDRVDTLFLNDKGLVEKATSTNPSEKTIMFQYNNDGTLKSNYRSKDNNVTLKYHKGNEISSTITDSGKITSTMTCTYYSDKVNTIGNDNMGWDFCGLSSKNPVKSDYLSLTGEEPIIHNYTYQYDGKGRIKSKAAYTYSYDNRLMDSTTYSYY